MGSLVMTAFGLVEGDDWFTRDRPELRLEAAPDTGPKLLLLLAFGLIVVGLWQRWRSL